MDTNSSYLKELRELMSNSKLPEELARSIINEKIKTKMAECYICGKMFLGRKKYCSMECELVYKKVKK